MRSFLSYLIFLSTLDASGASSSSFHFFYFFISAVYRDLVQSVGWRASSPYPDEEGEDDEDDSCVEAPIGAVASGSDAESAHRCIRQWLGPSLSDRRWRLAFDLIACATVELPCFVWGPLHRAELVAALRAEAGELAQAAAPTTSASLRWAHQDFQVIHLFFLQDCLHSPLFFFFFFFFFLSLSLSYLHRLKAHLCV